MKSRPPRARSGADDPLTAALEAARTAPEREEAWLALEELAASLQKPDEVAALYQEVLAKDLATETVRALGQRAVGFYQEWFGESHPGLIEILTRVLHVDAGSDWAFERLTVVLTVSERWTDLLAAYDRAVAMVPDRERRAQLLREAAELAKDFAAQPDRAIDYLKQLHALSPEDGQLSSSMERLLERQERWPELIELWRKRLETQPADEAQATRERIASCLLDRLGDARGALDEIATLADHDRALALLEQILTNVAIPAEVRRAALGPLRSRYDAIGRGPEVVQALDVAIGIAGRAERLALHREAAERLTALGREQDAIRHYDEILALEPPPADQLASARRLGDLLEDGERRLAVLERLAAIEPREADRRTALGHAARLAGQLGQVERALASWGKRLEQDPNDLAALDAVIEIHEQGKSWRPLVEALRRRVLARVPPHQVRADLIRMAAVQAQDLGENAPAIETWGELRQRFGDEPTTVDALVALLAQTERWADLATLLEHTASLESTRLGAALVQLGDAYRLRLAAPEQAAACYRRALEADPKDTGARSGLRALVELETTRSAAVAALSSAATRTDDAALKLELSGHRLAVAGSAAEKVTVLVETAGLQERAGDAAAAVKSLARALPLAPDDARLEADLLRLAEQSADWAIAVEALREAASALAPEAPRGAELRAREGALLEERLDDRPGALAAYAAAGPDASIAVARVAVRLGKWDAVSRAIVTSARRSGRLDPAVFEVIDGATKVSWEKLPRALSSAVAEARDLPAEVARGLETRIALWYRDRREDANAAQVALLRAVGHDGNHVPTLEMLAELQRRTPGRPLHDTLLRLADAKPGNLDPLHEAAVVAVERLGDRTLAIRSLERLAGDAQALLRREQAATGERAAAATAAWAIQELARLAGEEGQHAARVERLLEAWQITREPELLHQAAETAADKLGDRDRAVDLYRRLLETSPGDARASERLGALYAAQDRLPELLLLRRRELGLATDPDRRISLRLDVARLVGALEDRGGRIEALRANLEEALGHEASIDALCEVLTARTRYLELADILSDQATRLESSGHGARASALWLRVARLSEQELGSVDRALASYERVARLDAATEALDALARLYIERGDHPAAVRWLEQRLQTATDAERTPTALRLATACVAAGDPARAVACLERALATDPTSTQMRSRLAELYREVDSWEALARLLVEGCAQTSDRQILVGWAREAAEIYQVRLGTPEQAVPALEKVSAIVPDERWVRSMLAESLRAAGRLDEARTLLEGLVQDFGRRRSPERAAIHQQLARVARAQGKGAEALDQLELASGMDVGNTLILKASADLAREEGQIDRAERAYRALLLVLRRHKGAAPDVGASEVLFELHRIAAGRGQADAARELLESALDAAVQNEAEAARLERALMDAREHELLLRLLQLRLDSREDAGEQASVLDAVAGVLDTLGRSDEALDARLRALALSPRQAALHLATRKLAARAGRSERYIEAMEALLLDHGRRKEDAELTAQLLLRMGEVAEQDLRDLDRAASLYARAEAAGGARAQVLEAMASLAGARGDTAGQIQALEALVQTGAPDGLYRIAEVQLADRRTLDDGMQSLSRALESSPQYERAMRILETAKGQGADVSKVMPLYEWVARRSGDARMLLDFLERRAAMPQTTPEQVREGVDIAHGLHEEERAEALMVLAVERARALSGGVAEAGWALVPLARRRKAASDPAGAIGWWLEAAALGPESESIHALGLELAQAAPSKEAASVYQRLLDRDPAAREVWEPLARIFREQGDLSSLDKLVTTTLSALVQPSDRNILRMERARLLCASRKKADQAIEVLRDVLLEDPEHREAESLLADLLEKSGRVDDLTELLSRQLEAATHAKDVNAVAALSLRLGGLLEEAMPAEAKAVYRAALAVSPADRTLLRGVLRLLGPDDDARERADLIERILNLETGEAAAALSLEVAAVCERLGDPEGLERALEHGYRAAPNAAVRDWLERLYRERQDLPRLAEMLAAEATRTEDPARAVELLKEAAILQRDLGSPAASADLLRRAVSLQPSNVALVEELARALDAAGETRAAAEEIGQALEKLGPKSPRELRIKLFCLRADLRRAQKDDAGAVDDLEQAFALGPAAVREALIEALVQRRARASERQDVAGERAATLRLVSLELAAQSGGAESGGAAAARELLVAWLARDPRDREALQLLRDIDTAAERWDDLVGTLSRLAEVEEEPAARSKAALALAEICERIGRPGDARAALEAAVRAGSVEPAILEHLRRIYEQTGAHRELAELLLFDAEAAADEGARFARLRQAGVLFLAAREPLSALPALEAALAVRPAEHETTLLLIDAHTQAGHHEQAGELLRTLIAAHKRKKSPEVCELQLRMSRVALAAGDQAGQLEWLKAALDSDRTNGPVAGELADLAENLEDWDTALKALQAVTLMKSAAPMTHPVAFLRQARIAIRRGERPRAVLWAKRALVEDPSFLEADQFLKDLGE